MSCNHSNTANGAPSGYHPNQDQGTWLQRHRTLILGTGFAAAATALALSQHWIALVTLVPLLYVLPCMLMMFMCMKGMNHGGDKEAVRVPAQSEDSNISSK